MKRYSELIRFTSFRDRFMYLQLRGQVGADTFGYDRYLNQALYSAKEWKKVRREIILRDGSCDLAHPDHPIYGNVYIHHINPITEKDVLKRDPKLFDPDNLVCVSFETHNAIHYGAEILSDDVVIERTKYDTVPWKGVS